MPGSDEILAKVFQAGGDNITPWDWQTYYFCLE